MRGGEVRGVVGQWWRKPREQFLFRPRVIFCEQFLFFGKPMPTVRCWLLVLIVGIDQAPERGVYSLESEPLVCLG